MATFSIIVPILNEQDDLPEIVKRLEKLKDAAVEIVIVDGGSVDQTASKLSDAGFRVLSGGIGRGLALNMGARVALGDILVFLHADTDLPVGWRAMIQSALSSKRHAWGRFDIFIAGQSPLLPMVAMLMNIRSRLTGIATGDQAIFVARTAYEQIGGVPEQPLMEDIELSRRLKVISTPACLSAKARTSGRRWDRNGVVKTIFQMWRLRILYYFGTSPEVAYYMYNNNSKKRKNS